VPPSSAAHLAYYTPAVIGVALVGEVFAPVEHGDSFLSVVNQLLEKETSESRRGQVNDRRPRRCDEKRVACREGT
jgi:hypothetical protein